MIELGFILVLVGLIYWLTQPKRPVLNRVLQRHRTLRSVGVCLGICITWALVSLWTH